MRKKYLGSLLLISSVALSFNANAAERGFAYVSNQEGGVSVINLDSMEVESNIDIQAKSPRGIGVTADGKLLITANKDSENIAVIDRATGQLIKHIPVGKNPESVRVFKNFAFISTEPASTGKPPAAPGEAQKEDDDDDKIPAKIAVVDLKKGKKVREITGGPETEGLEFSADGKKLIVTNEADNTITVVGNLTRDPELRFTTGGRGVASFGIAVGRRYQVNGEWQEQTSYFNITAWGTLGENAAATLTKGSRVIVTGRLEQREYTNRDGDKRTAIEIVADELGPSLRWATAQVERTPRDGGGSGGGGGRSGGGGSQPEPFYAGDEEPF